MVIDVFVKDLDFGRTVNGMEWVWLEPLRNANEIRQLVLGRFKRTRFQ